MNEYDDAREAPQPANKADMMENNKTRYIMASEIRNPELWQDGRLKIEWVRHHMPLLNSLEEEFARTLPFKGLKVALSVHLEAKTAYLCEVLAAGEIGRAHV